MAEPKEFHSAEFPGLSGTDDVSLAEVEYEIREAIKTQPKILLLTRRDLTGLPAIFDQLTQLDIFSCSGNQLRKLPPSLGRLVRPILIDCADNLLEELPRELGDLALLENLSCGGNKLTELPIELGKCAALKELRCGDNPFKEGVPQTIEGLREAWRTPLKSAGKV